jgi:hypothetical protein
VFDAGNRVNILNNKKTCKGIIKGLEELKKGEWISENEYSTLISFISQELKGDFSKLMNRSGNRIVK